MQLNLSALAGSRASRIVLYEADALAWFDVGNAAERTFDAGCGSSDGCAIRSGTEIDFTMERPRSPVEPGYYRHLRPMVPRFLAHHLTSQQRHSDVSISLPASREIPVSRCKARIATRVKMIPSRRRRQLRIPA